MRGNTEIRSVYVPDSLSKVNKYETLIIMKVFYF